MKQEEANKMKMKKFRAYWGKGYRKKGTKVVNENFFTKSRGYSAQNIYDIKTLAKEQRINLTDMSGTHTVKRIK